MSSYGCPKTGRERSGLRQRFREGKPAPFLRTALFSIGLQAIDLDPLTEFYKTAPGYLVTERDYRDAVGDLPAPNVVFLTRDPESREIVLVVGRRTTVPSSIRQSAFHVPSALRDVHERLRTHPEVSSYHPVDHDNPFSLYCNDPENDTLELSRESTWYMLAPSVWTLDFSVSNEETLRVSKKRGHSMTGFMMREE